MQIAEAEELRRLVVASTLHVLPSCGIAAMEPIEPAAAESDEKQVVAFLGFTGDALRGTIAIVAPVGLLRAAYPLPLADKAQWQVEVFDWAGEIANRLIGRVRSALAPFGVTIEASTPRVMQGEQLHVTRSTQGTICSAYFPVGTSWVRVWFDATAADERPLFAGVSAAATSVPAEGEPVLF
jgi:CheY-specific phosphatase CheX